MNLSEITPCNGPQVMRQVGSHLLRRADSLVARCEAMLDRRTVTVVSELETFRKNVRNFFFDCGPHSDDGLRAVSKMSFKSTVLGPNPSVVASKVNPLPELPRREQRKMYSDLRTIYGLLKKVRTRLDTGTVARMPYSRLAADELGRRKRIFAVIRKGVKGQSYCKLLENEGIKPRRAWIDEQCPSNYPEAFRSPKWRKRIQDEKSGIARRNSLQGTRRTRSDE